MNHAYRTMRHSHGRLKEKVWRCVCSMLLAMKNLSFSSVSRKNLLCVKTSAKYLHPNVSFFAWWLKVLLRNSTLADIPDTFLVYSMYLASINNFSSVFMCVCLGLSGFLGVVLGQLKQVYVSVWICECVDSWHGGRKRDRADLCYGFSSWLI